MSIISINEWIYVENSPINIFATGQMKNFINNEGKSVKSAGSSFAAAFISGHISKQLDLKPDISNIDMFLKKNAIRVYTAPVIKNQECFDMNKIVIFHLIKKIILLLEIKKCLKWICVLY